MKTITTLIATSFHFTSAKKVNIIYLPPGDKEPICCISSENDLYCVNSKPIKTNSSMEFTGTGATSDNMTTTRTARTYFSILFMSTPRQELFLLTQYAIKQQGLSAPIKRVWLFSIVRSFSTILKNFFQLLRPSAPNDNNTQCA